MAYVGSPPAPQMTVVAPNTVETADIQDNAVTAVKISATAITDKLGFTPASTGKAIAMAIVFGG
jgi:hypothetical protein